MSIYLCLPVSFLSICLPAFVGGLSTCLSALLSVCLPSCLPTCMQISACCLNLCITVCLSFCLSVYLFICLAAWMLFSACISVRPSVRLRGVLSAAWVYLVVLDSPGDDAERVVDGMVVDLDLRLTCLPGTSGVEPLLRPVIVEHHLSTNADDRLLAAETQTTEAELKRVPFSNCICGVK